MTGPDVGQALSLLKLLLYQPNRQAPRDWIVEQFWPDQSRGTAIHRLETVFSRLKALLMPPEGGNSLLSSTRSRHNGPLYAVAPYPSLWVDADAARWNVEQAARMERFGDDSLPFWERAFELLTRGPFLADELYTEWVNQRREQVEGEARQCVHALARLYMTRYGEVGNAGAADMVAPAQNR